MVSSTPELNFNSVLWSYLHTVDLVIKAMVTLEKTFSWWLLINIQRFPTSKQFYDQLGVCPKSCWYKANLGYIGSLKRPSWSPIISVLIASFPWQQQGTSVHFSVLLLCISPQVKGEIWKRSLHALHDPAWTDQLSLTQAHQAQSQDTEGILKYVMLNQFVEICIL